jgi:hypothetical protein
MTNSPTQANQPVRVGGREQIGGRGNQDLRSHNVTVVQRAQSREGANLAFAG